jgi:hypothetical protein
VGLHARKATFAKVAGPLSPFLKRARGKPQEMPEGFRLPVASLWAALGAALGAALEGDEPRGRARGNRPL